MMGAGAGQMGMGAGMMLGGLMSGIFGSKEHKSLKHDIDRLWAMYYMPALNYYQWLMDVGRHPEKYPEVIDKYLGFAMPKIGEWATARGVYNPAAVARKTSENLFPFLMGLGQQGAAGMVGGWQPPPGWEMDLAKLADQMGVAKAVFGQGLSMMGGGMGMGMGGGQQWWNNMPGYGRGALAGAGIGGMAGGVR